MSKYFKIDLSDVANEFQLTRGEIEQMSKLVADDVTFFLIRLIQSEVVNSLNSTRREYLQSLKKIDKGKAANAIVLMGKLPNMIEQGASSFDMKEGFSKSSKVKYNKNGSWFLHIPFRWATPGALGENAAFSNILPQEIYDSIQENVQPTKTGADGKKISGGGLKSIHIPAPFSEVKKREKIGSGEGEMAEYTHKSSLFEGITKVQKTYESATQNQYFSFRTVSENSDSNSWIHRGIKAYNFFEKALRNQNDLDNQVENSIDKFLKSKGY